MEKGSYHHQQHLKSSSQRLENIQEESTTSWFPASLRPPETPTETMEFLARSWSLSAMEISKALTVLESKPNNQSTGVEVSNDSRSKIALEIPVMSGAIGVSPPISPRDNIDMKLLRVGARGGKSMGGWLKEQKEKKRAEARARNAQLYAATSVAGVAAAVAAIVAGTVFSQDGPKASNGCSKTAAAVASAAALVASHCMETAQIMGAGHEQIVTVIQSAVNAQTSGDIMALTAGAATALRGAATLRARLHKELQGATLTGENKESDRYSSPLIFVSKGGELLKRTRKGILHWKQVSVYINSSWQVVVKMKSTHMAGTFIKKKKSVIIDVCSEIPAWPGRELEDGTIQRAYFGIKTPERVIEFECRNKCDQQIWIEGIRQMLHRPANMNIAMSMYKSSS